MPRMNRFSPFVSIFVAGGWLLFAERPQQSEQRHQIDDDSPPRRPFTHSPVDIQALFAADTFKDAAPISPYFNYDNTAHAEGPRKWYLYGSSTEPLKVFLPARAELSRHAVMTSGESGELQLKGEKVWLNMHVTFQVNADLRIIFMHLCLRDEILRKVDRAQGRQVWFPAGTHVGYVHYPPWNSLDFAVEDRRKNSRMASEPTLSWNLRTNPLDYFVPELRQQILSAYRSTLDQLKREGTAPYSDLTDSRANINISETLWGVWFKDDLAAPFRDHEVNWSIINAVPKKMLHRATYSKVLEEDPNHAGLFTENGKGRNSGQQLYDGAPLGRSRLYLLSGDERDGTAKIAHRFDPSQFVFLKFAVRRNAPNDPHDDQLRMESFPTSGAAEENAFSDQAVLFRRDPRRSP